MKNPSAKRVTFYVFTDPETADKVADRGFAGVGVWSDNATVTLFDQPLAGSGGAVLRVGLTQDAARELEKHLVDADAADGRTYAAPLSLLDGAYIARVSE